MTTLATIEADATKYGPVALQAAGIALAIIGVGGAPAAVLAGVEAVLNTLEAGTAAAADPAAISADLAKLLPEEIANDRAADAALDAKFPA